MNNNVYLLYTCDDWMSYDSMVLMGVFSSDESLLDGVGEIVADMVDNFADGDEEPDETIERVAQEFLDCNLQTQGYDKNIFAKCVELNKVEEVL